MTKVILPPAKATWTAGQATELRRALRMTIEQFAAALGAAPRTVAGWSANPDMVPNIRLQDALDRLNAVHQAGLTEPPLNTREMRAMSRELNELARRCAYLEHRLARLEGGV